MEDFDRIVKNASKGDMKAFEQICNIKGQSIVYLCIKSMENVQDGEDAAQEVFIRLQKGIRSLKQPGAFNRWLYLLVQSTCNDLRRKNLKKKSDFPIDEFEDFILEEKTEYLPQDIIEDEEKRLQLQEVINKMSYNMRMSVVLFYYEGLTREEIGNVLSLPANTIKTILYRARIKIRKEIEILEPDYKKSASLMPMIFMRSLLQEDAAAVATKSIVQQCASSALQAAEIAAVGIAASGAAAAGVAATSAASASVAGIVTAAISVALVGVCLTATIVSANNPVTSNPSDVTVSDGVPQRNNQTEQSMVEDIASENALVIAPSHPSQQDSSTGGAVQDDDSKSNLTATDSQAESSTENQKYNFTGTIVMLDKNDNPLEDAKGSIENIRISIVKNSKTIAQTTTNSQGKYSFSQIPLEKGEYEIKAILPSERIAEFSSKNEGGLLKVSVGDVTSVDVEDIYIVNNRAPSIAVLLYDENQKVTNSNPKEVKVYISEPAQTEYILEIYSEKGELVCQGDKQKIDGFLQNGLQKGKYKLKLTVTDIAKNQTIDQLNFYIV